MGSEQGPEYYDQHVKRVSLPLEESPWLDLYVQAASLLPSPHKSPRIADVGCGTGRFAKLLHDLGYKGYWGVDFSSVRIRQARLYVPCFEFSVGSVFDDSVERRLKQFDVYVLLEFLEHIENDISFLSTLPPNRLVVFSVPNYDSAAHVRCFNNTDEIISRYQRNLGFSFSEFKMVENKRRHGRVIFLTSCRTKRAENPSSGRGG